MTSRQQAAIRRSKEQRALEAEAREQAHAARRACVLAGLCTTCGADVRSGAAHGAGCPEGSR